MNFVSLVIIFCLGDTIKKKNVACKIIFLQFKMFLNVLLKSKIIKEKTDYSSEFLL